MKKIIIFTLIFVLFSFFSCKEESTVVSDNYDEDNNAECTVIMIQGEVTINSGDLLAVGDTIQQNDTIRTMKDSLAEIEIGDGSVIRVEANSELAFNNLFDDGETKSTELFLAAGKVFAKPEKLEGDSSFEVKTETVTAGVRGTEFVVSISDDKKIQIAVREGKVAVKNNITLNNAKNLETLNKDISDAIQNTVNKEIIIETSEYIEIKSEDVKTVEKEVNEKVDSLIKLLNTESIEAEEINDGMMMKELSISAVSNLSVQKLQINDKLHNEMEIFDGFKNNDKTTEPEEESEDITEETTTESETETEEEPVEKVEVTLSKVVKSFNLSLSDKSTFVTSDSYGFYITDAQNKKVLGFIPSTGTSWVFEDPQLGSIASAAINYQNNLVLASDKKLFFVNRTNGKLIKKLDSESSPTFWSTPIPLAAGYCIPTNRLIIKFANNTFTEASDLNSQGQIYGSGHGNKVAFLSLDKTVGLYNAETNNVEWTGSSIDNNGYMHPYVDSKYIVASDAKNGLYRFDYSSGNPDFVKLDVPSGTVSNMIGHKGFLYYVAIDGGFYRINLSSFNKATKLGQAESGSNVNSLLVKRLSLAGDTFYFPTDSGKLFTFNNAEGAKFTTIESNTASNKLLGKVVIVNDDKYFVDNKGNIHRQYTVLQ